ncbi:MAG: SMI1/KNR4 family protein [Myxococcales bacterium]|nr:SMI1/KNR4 family protein [Myxococcales bacterium]
MQNILDRLVARLAKDGAALTFRPGVDDAALDAAEAQLGHPLTPSLRALLRVANGQATPPQYEPGAIHLFPADMRLYSLKRIVSEHASQAESHSDEGYDDLVADDAVRCVSWHSGRVPFAGAADSAWLWIDHVPGPGGSAGQVLYNTSEVDMALMGASVEDFLRRYLDALDSGALVVTHNEDEVFMVHADGRDPTEDWYDVLCVAE